MLNRDAAVILWANEYPEYEMNTKWEDFACTPTMFHNPNHMSVFFYGICYSLRAAMQISFWSKTVTLTLHETRLKINYICRKECTAKELVHVITCIPDWNLNLLFEIFSYMTDREWNAKLNNLFLFALLIIFVSSKICDFHHVLKLMLGAIFTSTPHQFMVWCLSTRADLYLWYHC
jgi:hypothetical protein